MKEKELRGVDEVLVGDTGETVGEFSVDGNKKKITRIIIFLIILIIIAGIVVALVLLLKKDKGGNEDSESDRTKVLVSDDQFIKPKNTIRKYELIELEKSKYKFILIEDPKSFNGGVEIRANLGSDTEFADGFAHFAEHIFFGGNEKVTELDLNNLVIPFDEIIDAYTADEETVFLGFGPNYTFSTLLESISSVIQNQKLNKTYLQTETDVVTSEYDNGNNSYSNYYDIYRENANPEHSFSQTITGKCGNKETLGSIEVDKMQEMLRNYYRILFKPENCVFVLHSSKSLKEMRLYAQKYFDFKLEEPTQEYKNLYKDKEKALDNPMFLENSLGKIAFFNYTRDTPSLFITFPISLRSGNVEIDKILRYLFYKKEDNSLLQYLYDNNFISYYNIDWDGLFKNNEIITFNFDLTKDGYENIDKIIEAFFATVNALRDSDNIQDLLNNLKLIDNSTFINLLEAYPIDIDDILNVLNNYVLFGPEKMLGSPNDLMYKENRIKEIINELSVENAFIFIDSKDELKSKYLTSDELLFTKNYKTPYRMNKIDEDYLNNLTTIKTVDNYTFGLRTKNEKFTKLKELTKKPCYENKDDKCEYDEYNPNEDKIYKPYVVRNSDGVYSLMKIDRSFGVPFVKGYIELILDENKFNDVFNDTANIISYYLFLYSFDYKFSFSDLYEGGSTISIPQMTLNKIIIEFSTYNDLLEDVIKYIIDFFETPIDESTFNSMKEKIYLLNSNENGVSIRNIFNDAQSLFERFMAADSLDEPPYDKESFYSSSYSDYNDTFFSATSMITNLKYLTHGDISYEQSNRTTEELSNLINKTLEVTLKLSAPKKIEIPENTSILYSYKIQNPYQRQGGVLVRYEFDRTLISEMDMYSLCSFSFFFDYLRTKRGTGYNVRIMPVNMGDKFYLQIFAIGKVYSPEKMDRFINEAIIESFSYKKCLVDEVINHMENKFSAPSFYAEDKFNDLKSFLDPEQMNSFKLNKENDFNYDTIVQKIKETLIDKPKRIAILLHRGDITDEEYEKQKGELDKTYFLNANIKNELTEDIKYLNKYEIN